MKHFELALENDPKGEVLAIDTINENILALNGLLKSNQDDDVLQSLQKNLQL